MTVTEFIHKFKNLTISSQLAIIESVQHLLDADYDQNVVKALRFIEVHGYCSVTTLRRELQLSFLETRGIIETLQNKKIVHQESITFREYHSIFLATEPKSDSLLMKYHAKDVTYFLNVLS